MGALVMRLRAKRLEPRLTRGAVTMARDLEALCSIAWAGYLTTGQIAALHYPSRRKAQRRLRVLLDAGLVRGHLQGGALHVESVFTLTDLGVDRLVTAGSFPEGRPRRRRLPRLQKLAHALAIREVFVALLRAERAGHIVVGDVRFENELVGEAPFAAHGLVPDAFATIDVSGHAVLLGVEVDLGSERHAVLRSKLATWRVVLSLLAAPGSAILLIAVAGRARTAAVARLVQEAGFGTDARCAEFPDVAELFASGWTHPPAAPPGRAERPGHGFEARGLKGVPGRATPAFRA